jgi:hypothetical protein
LDFRPAELRGMTTITANRDNLTIQIDVDMPINTTELSEDGLNTALGGLSDIA